MRFLGIFGLKIQICLFRVKSATETNSNMQNSSVKLEIPFLSKFSPKNQNNQFQLKFNTLSKSNIKNSIVMFTHFVYERYSFLRQICFKKSNLLKLKFGTQANLNM